MKIGELFDTPVADKIEPVIKVGERADEGKLAGEVSSYVVTPTIERHLDDMLEHWTDTLRNKQTEIGIWISGYFGSGKSHFAKIFSLLVSNPTLKGRTATEIFDARLPHDAPYRPSILRSLSRVDECDCDVLAFNLNTIADSRTRPLPSILLSQYYQAQGFSANLIYARVIEAELARQGKLDLLHASVEKRTGKKWSDIQSNPTFFRNHLYDAVVEVAPEHFASRESVDKALAEAQQGELHNVRFLVQTILNDLAKREAETGKEQRLLFVLDESGQWIEDDAGRLSQLQALVEEAAVAGQGKIWIIVTTHGDMGSIFKEAKALEGDMKKIEGRFRFKPALTTENIELVLEDRLFRKTVDGKAKLQKEYETKGSGTIRGLGELANVTSRSLPSCTVDSFPTYYPFFPYQVHLIPEIVKSLRSKGGRGEQMSGSTRTLLAITQDILRSGRQIYLDQPLGTLVAYHELYYNLAGEGEVSPDVRTDIGKIKKDVPGATDLTMYVAEVLFLIRELSYIPRSIENVARLLAESTDDDVMSVVTRIQPEIDRLMKAGLVGKTGDEYEFLTGERRSFEEDVATVELDYKQQDREKGLQDEFVYSEGKIQHREWLDSNVVEYQGHEFTVKTSVDGFEIPGHKGDVKFRFYTPLAIGRITLAEIENQSLREDNQDTVFFVSGRVNEFDRDLQRYLAMKTIIANWIGDPQKSEDARLLAEERNNEDLPKLRKRVLDHLRTGIKTGHLVFRGSSRQVTLGPDQSKPSKSMRANMSEYWPRLYPKFDKVPVRVTSEQRAIKDVLSGETTSATQDVKSLKLFDKAGKVDLY
ncbi:MAG: BREX system P-loop protein BrxC, partial [Novipirellula sp. JB048]